MKLYLNDENENTYELTVDTEEYSVDNRTFGAPRADIYRYLKHHVTITAKVGEFEVNSNSSAEPTDLMNQIFEQAKRFIERVK